MTNESTSAENGETVGGSPLQAVVMRVAAMTGGNNVFASVAVIAAQWLIVTGALGVVLAMVGPMRFIAILAILKLLDFIIDMAKISRDVWNA